MQKLLLGLILLFLAAGTVLGNSKRAYEDYLYQLDVYRQKNNEFKLARNEYEKFKTLTSQNTALEKTIAMLVSRAQLLRSYLLLLSEKVQENPGVTFSDAGLYQSLIKNEMEFLDGHMQLVSAIGTLEDADAVASDLSSHYIILTTSEYQTIIGLSLGQLNMLKQTYDESLEQVEALVNVYKSSYKPSKQATIDRWLISIKDKRDLYERKVSDIASRNSGLKSTTIEDIQVEVNGLVGDIQQAKAYLADGTSFMNELLVLLKTMD
ncbi:hypothetical protein A2154_04485 [Candidatus Gottesmanbacteria bacterium RBG_16_43_7]|uniref:Uncharacterized protein n=1 Tax=Candidatus Gottesmanbacteria bacterium RBG_16_43_7 TaxID=1798373 RepID=A0A1F5Z835_9BACT|nr:MAG: hypothetical protein A2154_04485 [Candidatus Gottesmanbacteria bacterium RBG_16_43_7]